MITLTKPQRKALHKVWLRTCATLPAPAYQSYRPYRHALTLANGIQQTIGTANLAKWTGLSSLLIQPAWGQPRRAWMAIRPSWLPGPGATPYVS